MEKKKLYRVLKGETILAVIFIYLIMKGMLPGLEAFGNTAINQKFFMAVYGEVDNPLRDPASVAVDDKGRIYVADAGNNQVQVFHPNGRFSLKFGEFGQGKGQMKYPVGIAVNSDEEIFVTEVDNLRVQVFNKDGDYLRAFPKNKKDLKYPTAIAIDEEDNVFVIDKASDTVKKFSPEGQLLLEFGGIGTEAGKFKSPMGIAVKEDGNIVVSDSGNARVQIFDGKGKLLSVTKEESKFMLPRGVIQDGLGRIFVADTLGNYIAQLNPKGEPVKVFGQTGEQNEQFYYPDGMAYQKGKLYIADKGNNRIVVYEIAR